MVSNADKSEIAFFDVETSVPARPGQGFAILEFGAILVCPKKLIELENYSTLVKPFDLSLISNLSVRCNGITRDAVISAPTFAEIADKVYDILHGRIWAGHNILRFDCARIREAFAEINRPAPEPKGTIDSLALLTQKFGRRAGDMKMATLATYFGIGQQTHRSLDDVRMNLEVLKYCATVLFLESSLPDIFTENSWVSPNAITRSRRNEKASPEGMGLDSNKPSSSSEVESHVRPTPANYLEEAHPILSFATQVTNKDVQAMVNSTGPLESFSTQMNRELLQLEDSMAEEESASVSRESSTSLSGGSSGHVDFLEPDKISVPSVSVILAPFYHGTQKMQILHENVALQVCCRGLKVRFGIGGKYFDNAGRPKLNIVVEASTSLCSILDEIDKLAQRLSADSGSSSEWRPCVNRNAGYFSSPTVRLHLPIVTNGDVIRWATEIYHKEESLVFRRFDTEELETLVPAGKFVDAYFSLDTYDYQQSAGIRLVAKKLILHLN